MLIVEQMTNPNFSLTRYTSLRSVPAYVNALKECFNRNLDLYLCPRVRKKRVSSAVWWSKTGNFVCVKSHSYQVGLVLAIKIVYWNEKLIENSLSFGHPRLMLIQNPWSRKGRIWKILSHILLHVISSTRATMTLLRQFQQNLQGNGLLLVSISFYFFCKLCSILVPMLMNIFFSITTKVQLMELYGFGRLQLVDVFASGISVLLSDKLHGILYHSSPSWQSLCKHQCIVF